METNEGLIRVCSWMYHGNPIRHFLDKNDVMWYCLKDLQKILHMEDIPASCLPANQIRYAAISDWGQVTPSTALVNKGGVETLLWLQPEAVGNRLREFLYRLAGMCHDEREIFGD